jgi:hypothetical protein
MTYVLVMSTDPDIIAIALDAAWGIPTARYYWNQIRHGGLAIPAESTIVVIAHGNGNEIGNARPGAVDINAATFLALIHSNMAGGASPRAIYLSTCSPGIAQFTAAVRMAARDNRIWAQTQLFGHDDSRVGPVPAAGPRSLDWTRIF